MRELTEIVYGKNWKYRDNLSVGNCLTIRHKGDRHFHQDILITSLGYHGYNLISMNGKPMQEWLDNFEFLAHREWPRLRGACKPERVEGPTFRPSGVFVLIVAF